MRAAIPYGSNDDTKSSRDPRQMEKCFAVLGEENMPFRTISMREDFSDSCRMRQHYYTPLQFYRRQELSQASTVSKQCANRSTAKGNVITLYLMICPKANYHLADPEAVLRKVSLYYSPAQMHSGVSSASTSSSFLKLYKDFYGLETIDLPSNAGIRII